jgi:hypothetical protein
MCTRTVCLVALTLALDTGLFDSVICTGQFEDMLAKPGHELVTKLTKQEVILLICR